MRAIKAILILAALVWAEQAAAYYFVPTEQEWATWPAYCKAKYVGTGIGTTSPFANRVSRSERASWEASMGAPFVHIHHYCAGIAYLQRFHTKTDRRQKEYWLERATGEMTYTYSRINPATSIFPEVAKNLAMAHRYAGNHGSAISILRQAIQTHPGFASVYSALSLVYRDQDQPELQEQVLRDGLAVSEDSSELHYFLGLFLANQGRYDEATEHARKAYRLGYPLPGLKRKLARAGITLSDADLQPEPAQLQVSESE